MPQAHFDWSSDVRLPVVGRSLAARHAGATGAALAAKTRGALSKSMLDILAVAGPRGMSDDEMSDALGRGRSSMNSCRAGLGDLIVPSGSFQLSKYGTKRTRWTLNRERRG